MNVVVREASPSEFQAIAELLVEVYVGEGFTAAEDAARLRDVAGRAVNAQLLVAVDRDRGTVLGTVSLVQHDSPLVQISRSELEVELQLLATRPSLRGQGIGRALVSACLDRACAQGYARAVLWTQPTMAAAHRLYQLHGFRRVPERDWVRPNGGNALVYALDLSQR